MGLEVATYINQLVPTNPTGSDLKSFGDDHLRLIKSAIKNTFPNISQAVNVTAAQLNAVADTTQYVKPGMVIMWAGSLAQIPAGWKLCNGVGTTSNGIPVPNLIGAFPWGIDGTSQAVGTRGGSANIVWSGMVSGTALTLDQIPSHNHIQGYGSNRGEGGRFGTASNQSSRQEEAFGGNPTSSAPYTSSVGGGQAHDHSVSINMPLGNIPPFCSVFFIIKN
ncbi:tail fibers protein [Pseudomonas phage vB_Pae_WS1160]